MKRLVFIWFILLTFNVLGQEMCNNYTVNPGTSISGNAFFIPGTFNETINVPNGFDITDVNITVDISHNNDEDLSLFLISPYGNQVPLSVRNGGTGNNYTTTTFDDAAADPITTGTAPFNGTFQPEGSLADYNSQIATGNWTLRVVNDGALLFPSSGTINSISLEICYTPIGGHTGPGGIGQADGTSALALWLDANQNISGSSPITNWGDASGNAVTTTIVGDPELTSSSVNTLDAIAFDGTLDIINTNLNINFSVMPNVSILSVYKPNNADPGGVWGEDNLGWDRFLLNRSSNPIFISIVSNGSFSSAANNNIADIFPVNNYVSTTVLYNQDADNGTEVYANEDLERTFTSSQSGTSDNFLIGSIDTRPNIFEFDGDIAEVIVYDQKLTEVERIIVNNYLSAKYNTPLITNNFYNEDENGDFDFDVAGIGQASDGTSHTDSQGTGIVRINTPSALSNDDYLFWGRNTNGIINFASSPTYTERLNTSWRVSKTNNLGTVNFQIDLTGIDLTGKQACAPLSLIIDNDSDFLSPTQIINLTNVSGNIYEATGVNFSDNDYFSVEYIDTIVLDGTTYYNGSGAGESPDLSDSCYKFLVRASATGVTTLNNNAHVREVEVETGGNLAITDGNYLEIENGLQLNGDIRLVGNAQIIQNHTGGSQVTGSGKLYRDQESNIASEFSVYRYTYWSSPVVESEGDNTYSVDSVMKDGSNPTTNLGDPLEARNITWLTPDWGDLTSFNGDYSTSPISVSNYWIFTYKDGIDNTAFNRVWQNGPIPVGQGYLMKSTGNPANGQNFTFVGLPNDGEITVPVTVGTSNTNTIVGNPYPSTIDANEFIDDNSGVIEQTIYFWQHQGEDSNTTIQEGHTQSGYLGGYTSLNRLTGASAIAIQGLNSGGTGAFTYDIPGRYIPVGQGFLVTANSNGNIVFNNSQRAYRAVGSNSVFFGRSNNPEPPILHLGFEHTNQFNVNLHRQIAVGFKNGLSFNYENGFDSKIYDTNATDIFWKFPGNDDNYVIAGVQEFSTHLEIPLQINIANQQTIKFNIDRKANFPEGQKFFIKDTFTNQIYNLENPIEISLAAGEYSDRFFLVFEERSVLSTDESTTNNISIYKDNITQELVIKTNNNLEISDVIIYNVLGQKINSYSQLEIQETLRLPLPKTATGSYILRFKTNKGVFSKKILL